MQHQSNILLISNYFTDFMALLEKLDVWRKSHGELVALKYTNIETALGMPHSVRHNFFSFCHSQ